MSIPTRFMVVDDDPISNLICRFAIQGLCPEAEISLYTEPAVAMEAIERTFNEPAEQFPTVLFLDLNMPTMTGWEFLEHLDTRAQLVRERLTIYILSSSLNSGDIETAGNHPLVTGFISKPLTLGSLLREFNQQ